MLALRFTMEEQLSEASSSQSYLESFVQSLNKCLSETYRCASDWQALGQSPDSGLLTFQCPRLSSPQEAVTTWNLQTPCLFGHCKKSDFFSCRNDHHLQ